MAAPSSPYQSPEKSRWSVSGLLRDSLAVLLLAVSVLPARGSHGYFVVLQTGASPPATVTIDPPAGGLHSAAAQTDTGTTWNQLPYVGPVINPAGNVGNPATTSTVGTYTLYATPIALVDSTGAAAPVTLDVAVNYAGNTANGFNTVPQGATNPQALFGGVWRLTSGANSLTYTFANLPAADAVYDLYFYAAGAATNQQRGATITLAADNVPPEGAGAATTSGVSSGSSSAITLFDAGGALINQGVTWNVLRARANAARRIVFTQSRHPGGQNWCSGFQLVPVSVPLSIIGEPPPRLTGPLRGSVSISVTATGDAPLAYQWRKDGDPIDPVAHPSATSATLILDDLGEEDEGVYDVVVSDAQGSVTSTGATLTVEQTVAIPLPASSQISSVGGPATFAATVTGPATLVCQWYFDGSPLADGTGADGATVNGATTATLTLSNLQSSRAGRYHLAVTSGATTATSPVATLTLVSFAPPNIPDRNFDATAYGAIPDDITEDTTALQNAIIAASAAGGGTVLVAPGVFLSGPITLRNSVHLRLSPGTILRMLPMYSWPNSPYYTGTTPDFIQVNGRTNVLISGFGTIDGQGQAWWDRVDGSNGVPREPTLRPGSTIGINDSTFCAILDVSTLNPPNLHFGIKRALNVVVANATLRAPHDSPNTDGINIAGQNLVIDRCDISTGDDNIVINSGTSSGETRDIRLTNCVIGSGHGCAIGSFTSGGANGSGGYHGIKNVVVDRFTFNGTLSALTLKSSPGRGGVIQNLSYTNLTMNNVGSPFTIHCYYGTVGSPGATGSNGPTPATAANYNANPPVSLNTALLPEWRNILISDVVVNGCTNYAVIWGLPNRPVRGLTLRNITYNGGWGIRVYNATDVVLTGQNTFTLPSNRALFTTYNANIITGSPASAAINQGASASFTATTAGASGVSGAGATHGWRLNDAPLANGVLPDGTVVSGATTRTLSLANTGAAAAGIYTFVAANMLDGYDVSSSALAPASISAQATTNVALTVVPAFSTWALDHGLDPSGDGAPASDPDGDGVANLLEFAFGLDPVSSDPGSVRAENGVLVTRGPPFLHVGETLTARYIRRKSHVADGLSYIPRFSADLVAWENGAAPVVILAEDADHELVEIPLPAFLDASDRKFFRISVRRL